MVLGFVWVVDFDWFDLECGVVDSFVCCLVRLAWVFCCLSLLVWGYSILLWVELFCGFIVIGLIMFSCLTEFSE